MLNKRFLSWVILALVMILPSLAFSEQFEVKEYKVLEGDTLWGISAKELNDPFLWPKIWKENPDIPNPDRIMPGQIVKIPLYLIQKEEAPQEPVAEQPVVEEKPVVKAEPPKPKPVGKVTPPLVHRNIYTTSGFIGDMASFAGTIDGHFSGRTLFGTNDIVYVRMAGEAKPGDRFYIYQPRETVKHPATGESMGSIIEPVGVLEITKLEQGHVLGTILQSFTEIHIGDFLNPYSEMNAPVVEQPFRRPEIDGYIVASRKIRSSHLPSWNVLSDIVYIDRGSSDGLKPGDLIGCMSPDVFKNRQYNVPNGLLQIISTQERTATALVVKINEATPNRLIAAGNRLIKAE